MRSSPMMVLVCSLNRLLPAGRDDGLAPLASLDAVIFNPASPFNLFNR